MTCLYAVYLIGITSARNIQTFAGLCAQRRRRWKWQGSWNNYSAKCHLFHFYDFPPAISFHLSFPSSTFNMFYLSSSFSIFFLSWFAFLSPFNLHVQLSPSPSARLLRCCEFALLVVLIYSIKICERHLSTMWMRFTEDVPENKHSGNAVKCFAIRERVKVCI